jgi:hypothetical protein
MTDHLVNLRVPTSLRTLMEPFASEAERLGVAPVEIKCAVEAGESPELLAAALPTGEVLQYLADGLDNVRLHITTDDGAVNWVLSLRYVLEAREAWVKDRTTPTPPDLADDETLHDLYVDVGGSTPFRAFRDSGSGTISLSGNAAGG